MPVQSVTTTSTSQAPPPMSPSMDPRIRARLIEVRRRQGRRRLRLLMAGLVGLALVAAGLAALHSPLLAVRRVTVTGNHELSRAEVVAATGLGHRTLMIDVQAGRMEQALDRLPWVDSASVRRLWPSTIRIGITERLAVAQVRLAGGNWVEVDPQGRVLAASATPWSRLVTIAGNGREGRAPVGHPRMVIGEGPALAVASALPAGLRPDVQAVTLLGDGDVEVSLRSGGRAVLGPVTDLTAKLAAVQTMVAEVDMSDAKVLDVTVPEMPTLTRGQPAP